MKRIILILLVLGLSLTFLSSCTDNKDTERETEILNLMGFEHTVEAFPAPDDEVLLHIESPDAARLIGRNAQVLEALQLVLSRVMRQERKGGDRCQYVVDIERYRERKKDRLLKKALEAAEEARQSGAPVSLPAMGSADRRVVHQALRDIPDVETHSEEDADGKRWVVVAPKADAAEEG